MKTAIQKFILATSLTSIAWGAYGAQSQKLGCAEVVKREPVQAVPINSEAFIKIKNAGGGTGGMAAQILAAIPGASILSVAAGSLVADSAANEASAAFFNDERVKGKVYAVTFKFEDGQILTLPILKDDSLIFAKDRVVIAVITDSDGVVLRWGFPKADFVVAKPGEDNYENLCQNNVVPGLVAKIQKEYGIESDKPKAPK